MLKMLFHHPVLFCSHSNRGDEFLSLSGVIIVPITVVSHRCERKHSTEKLSDMKEVTQEVSGTTETLTW